MTEEQLLSLLALDVPDAEKTNIGFLEVIKKAHNETINSAIYAHFINAQEKDISDLFLNALTDLIEEKTDRLFSFGKAYATCEIKTNKGRIDIVIQDELSQQVIIIENKIFHYLNNDLMDYWNYFNCKADEKIGILLTPQKQIIEGEASAHFINITHLEWIGKVKSNGLPFGISNNYSIYINDFVKTVESFSITYKMNNQAKFYFEHAPKILKIQETSSAAQKFINNQLQLIAEKLGWQVYGNSMDWRNIWDEQNLLDTYLTIITSDLMKGEMKVTLILELNREDRNKYEEVEKHLENNEQFKRMKKNGARTSTYIHLGSQEYSITLLELENFANFIISKINEDFVDATLQAIKYLYPHKDISKWEQNFLNLGEIN